MADILFIIIGFTAGVVISGGIFSFINAVGLVPRMAIRTKTEAHIRFYEDFIILGALFGALISFFDIQLHIGIGIGLVYAILLGIFNGVLAIAVAEVLNVMPIMMRRTHITKGLPWIVLAFALGKLVGAILYFGMDGFYVE